MDTTHPIPDTEAPSRVGAGIATRRLTVIAAGVVVALIVAAVAVVRLAGDGTVSYPADSPEGVAQRYLAACQDGDDASAYAAFSQRVRRTLSEARFARATAEWRRSSADAQRVSLISSRTSGDRVTLRLRVEHLGGFGLFGRSRWAEETSVRLVREADSWHIDDALAGLDPVDSWS